MIKVKAVEGRLARTSPHGPFIPHDRYVEVEKTSYMQRLINHHGDVTVEPAPTKATATPQTLKKED